jgi:hypothetical protein
MSEPVIAKPKFPDEPTFEKVQAYKAAMRAYDLARIKAGLATAHQIQIENEAVHVTGPVKILNFPELEPAGGKRN